MTGYYKDACSFDGLNTSYISISDDDSLDFGTDDFTASAWIKGNAFVGLQPVIFNNFDQANLFGWKVYTHSDGTMRVAINDNNTISFGSIANSANVMDGTWHHVLYVGSRTDGKFYLYADGEYQGSVDISGTTGSVNNSEIKNATSRLCV